jgi:hypothetical protein
MSQMLPIRHFQAGCDAARTPACRRARARAVPPPWRPGQPAPSRGRVFPRLGALRGALKFPHATSSLAGRPRRHGPPVCHHPLPARARRPRWLAVQRRNGQSTLQDEGLEACPSPHRLFKGSPPLLAGSAPPPRHHGRPQPSFLLRTSPQPVRPPSPLHAPTDDARAAGQHALATISLEHRPLAATAAGLRCAGSPATLPP